MISKLEKKVNSAITSIVSTGDFVYFSTLNGNVFKLNIYSGELEKVMSLNNKVFQIEFNKVFYSLVIRSKNKITILNLDTMEKRYIYQRASSVKISPNGTYIAYALKDGVINILYFRNLEFVNKIKSGSDIITDMVLTNEILIRSGVDRLIKFYSINSSGELYEFKGHYNEIIKLILGPNEKTLISIGKDNKIVIWDLDKQRKKIMFTSSLPLLDFILPVDFTKIITSNYKGIDIWDFDGKKELTFASATPIISMIVLEDGYSIITGDKKGNLKLINPYKNIAIEEAFSRANLGEAKLISLADEAFENKNYEQVVRYYELALKPNTGLLKLANHFFENEKYEKAITYYKRVTDYNENINSKIAESYFKLGEYNQAYDFFLRAKNNQGMIKTAKMFNYEGNYYKALTLYIILAKIFKDSEDIEREKAMYLKIAELFTSMEEIKDYKGKVESVEEKKEIEKKLSLWFKDRYLLAEKYYEKAKELNRGLFNIANYLCNRDNYELALTYYDRINKKKASVISSNLSLEQIAKQYGSRITSRLNSKQFSYMEFTGNDIRTINK